MLLLLVVLFFETLLKSKRMPHSTHSKFREKHHYDDVKWMGCQNKYTPVGVNLSTRVNWFFIITRYYIK